MGGVGLPIAHQQAPENLGLPIDEQPEPCQVKLGGAGLPSHIPGAWAGWPGG